MRFQREVSGIEKLNDSIRIVPPEGLRTCRDEIWIMLPPYREERRLRSSEVLLESWVEPEVIGIVEKQVQLDVRVTGPRHQRGIERIAFGRDQIRV